MTLVDVAGHADERATGVAAPVGRKEAGERGHEVDAAVVLNGRGQRFHISRARDQAQVVTQPLHQCAGDRDRTFQGVHGRLVADLVAQGGQQSALARNGLGASVEQHEAAGAVGVLGLARAEARLPEEGRLLVAQVACHRHASQGALGRAIDGAGGNDLRQHGARHAHDPQDFIVPVERGQVHEHRAAGIGDVSHMHAAVGAAGQVPNDPGVNVAKDGIALLGRLANARHIVQDPAHLGAGEIGRQGQTNMGAEAILPTVCGPHVAQIGRARVLPDNGIVVRFASAAIPHDGGLALIGDANRGDVGHVNVALRQRALDHFIRARPDLHRIMLNPPRLGIDLLMFLLIETNHLTAVIKHHEASAGGALVYRCCILSHVYESSFGFQ